MHSPADQRATAADRHAAAAVDCDQLLQRCLGNVDLAQRLLDRFESEFPQELAELQQLAVGGDAEAIRSAAHRLKGAAASIAAPGLRDGLADVERMSEQRQLDEAVQAVKGLADEFRRMTTAGPLWRSSQQRT